MAEEKTKRTINRPTEGQRFPFISLPKALDRARALYKISNGHETPISTAARAWGYAEKSSGGLQTVSALKSFGLVEDIGTGLTRKIRLTEPAIKIIRDPRELSPERDTLVRFAAKRPLIHRQILAHFRGLPPSDELLKAHLIMDKGFRDEAVSEFMREFAETMAFAKVTDADTITADESPNSGNESTPISVGDFVQWEPSGVAQFHEPARVVGVSEDGQWLWVEGSQTGIPMAEVQIASAPIAASLTPPPPPPEVAAAIAATEAAKAAETAKTSDPVKPKEGMDKDMVSLAEGVVTIEFPKSLTEASVEELKEYFDFFIKKAKRRASVAAQ